MAKLPERGNRTVRAIYERYVNDNVDLRRDHLGASLIGSDCSRHLWYTFRWVSDPEFEGRILRLFERGQREETWIIEDLRALGMTVLDRDETKPKEDITNEQPQYRFEAHGGHFGGGCDGVVLGVLEAPKTWHLLEVKTSNDRRFKELVRDGVVRAQPQHSAQMQCYMRGLKLKRSLYICVNKNTDEIFVERLHYDASYAKALVEKAGTIIHSPEPLSKINEDPAWFECRFCSHRPICHLGEWDKLDRNCRTCLSSTPMPDGTWQCEYFDKELNSVDQRMGCTQHLFIPDLLPWQTVSADELARSVTYKTEDGKTVVDHKHDFFWE